jgi:hypothetical protein
VVVVVIVNLDRRISFRVAAGRRVVGLLRIGNRRSNFGKIRAGRLVGLHLSDAGRGQRRIRSSRTVAAIAANSEPDAGEIVCIVLTVVRLRLDVLGRLGVDFI